MRDTNEPITARIEVILRYPEFDFVSQRAIYNVKLEPDPNKRRPLNPEILSLADKINAFKIYTEQGHI